MTGCGGDGNNFVWFPKTTPTGPPTGVLATFNNASSATVSWNPVLDATSYNVYYSKLSGVSKTVNQGMVNTTDTSYTFEGAEKLDVDTPYYFVVTALKKKTESVDSLQVSAIYATFGQADLTGTWNVTLFRTGGAALPTGFGWIRETITLDAEGIVIVDPAPFYQDSEGGDTWPAGPGELRSLLLLQG